MCNGDKNLGPRIPGGLSFSSQGPLHLLGQADILDLHTVHVDTPGISGHFLYGDDYYVQIVYQSNQVMMHLFADSLSVRQDLRQVTRAKHIPEIDQ